MSAVLTPPASALIPVGSPWRLALRRPVFASLLLAAAFFLYTAPVKESPSLFRHAPWTDDPFDTVISFMKFFGTLIAVLCVPACGAVPPFRANPGSPGPGTCFAAAG
jgi:hypothetical protein